MDNTLMYYSPAEIEFRRQRAQRAAKARRRRRIRSPWNLRHGTDATS
jgi:hypothetical protein